jgi:hypothetical protein
MPRAISALLATYLVTASSLAQQWTAIVLHPAGMQSSVVTAVNATHQGGYVNWPIGSSTTQAGVWAGTAGSWTPFSTESQIAGVLGMDEHRQVGSFTSPPLHASMWTGTAQSWTSMHPAGTTHSHIAAVFGGMQVGAIRLSVSGSDRAALWRGSPESFLDLHPASALSSVGVGTDGVLQGGYIRLQATNTTVPVIWNGTAASMVNLRPGGSGYLHGMAPGVQVGEIFEPGMTIAALWRGSAASFVNLNPPGNNLARLRATTGRVHVGAFGQFNGSRAGVNFDSPTSWVSLHQFLPSEYGSFSEATCIYQSGPTIYVGGWARYNLTFSDHAILWIGTMPCYPNCDGSTQAPILNVADFTCFLQKFAAGDPYVNCDQSTIAPVLNVGDFTCFLQRFAGGCP